MISKEELEKWAFQLNMDGDCDATDKDIETLITQALETMEELEKAKRCLPVDKEFEVRGSWIGSVQNYIVHLEESLKDATAYIEKLREWNAGLAQESFERQERIAELTAGKVGNALLERENHHAKVVGHLVDLIIELKAKLSESSGNAFKEAYESGRTRHVPDVVDDLSIFEAAIEECKTCDAIDEYAWNHGVLVVMEKYESCRAAMLNGGKS